MSAAIGHDVMLTGHDFVPGSAKLFTVDCRCGATVVGRSPSDALAAHQEHARTAPRLQDWARACTVFADEGIISMLDGRPARHRDAETVRSEWYDTWGAMIQSRTLPHDPVGTQQAAARAAALARTPPEPMAGWVRAGWQRHAQQVARCARAEMCRVWGGTGRELQVIEEFEVPFNLAVVIVEHLARLDAGLPGLTAADGPS